MTPAKPPSMDSNQAQSSCVGQTGVGGSRHLRQLRAQNLAARFPEGRRHAQPVLADGYGGADDPVRRCPRRRRMGGALPEELPPDDGPGKERSPGAPRTTLFRRIRQAGQRRYHRRAAGRAHGLRAQHPQVHRLPPLRACLCRGEQPVARHAARREDRVDPGAAHGARQLRSRQDEPGLSRGSRHPGRRQRLHARRPGARGPVPLQPRGGAGEGCDLHADRLHAVREAALRQGLPGTHHLPRRRRPGGDRLQLVHRLPHVHGRLPLLGAPHQCHHPRPAQGGR